MRGDTSLSFLGVGCSFRTTDTLDVCKTFFLYRNVQKVFKKMALHDPETQDSPRIFYSDFIDQCKFHLSIHNAIFIFKGLKIYVWIFLKYSIQGQVRQIMHMGDTE